MNEMFPGFEKMKMIKLSEAAKYLNISTQAIYIAIKKGLLNASKVDGKYYVSLRMLDEYQKNRYNRRHSIFEGKPLLSENEFTIRETSEKLNLNLTHLYYLVRSGAIKSIRRGNHYIIKQEYIDQYLKTHPLTKTSQ
jgi:excisionase family DNA binding protein